MRYTHLAAIFALTTGLTAQVDHVTTSSSTQDSSKVRTVRDGTFGMDQSRRGKLQYATSCASCHGRDLSGDTEFSPALAGEDVVARWEGRSVGDLLATRAVMPQNNPGSLDPRTYADIVAYLLEANGFPP